MSEWEKRYEGETPLVGGKGKRGKSFYQHPLHGPFQSRGEVTKVTKIESEAQEYVQTMV